MKRLPTRMRRARLRMRTMLAIVAGATVILVASIRWIPYALRRLRLEADLGCDIVWASDFVRATLPGVRRIARLAGFDRFGLLGLPRLLGLPGLPRLHSRVRAVVCPPGLSGFFGLSGPANSFGVARRIERNQPRIRAGMPAWKSVNAMLLPKSGKTILARGTVLAVLLISPINGARSANDRTRRATEAQTSRPEQFAGLEAAVQGVYSRVAPSVVRIFPKEDDPRDWFGGVIVSPAGGVFTGAHHELPPQTKVAVELADGRRVKGTMLGLVRKAAKSTHYRAHDVGMMRLDEGREWPAVPLGRSYDLDDGEMCVAVGYPSVNRRSRPPLLRLGRVLPAQSYVPSGAPAGFSEETRGAAVRIARASARRGTWDALIQVGSQRLRLDRSVRGVSRSSSKWRGIVAERERPLRPILPPKYAWGAFEPAAVRGAHDHLRGRSALHQLLQSGHHRGPLIVDDAVEDRRTLEPVGQRHVLAKHALANRADPLDCPL